jgi:zona occludens toxin
MHRHLVHPGSGLVCEVALISQSIRDINENIKNVVQETYRMTKDTSVGSDKSFQVQVYARGSEMNRDEIRTFRGFYDPKFFSFYKSHSQAEEGSLPKEDLVDKRGNILMWAAARTCMNLAGFKMQLRRA